MPKIESYLDAMSPMDKMTEEDEMGEVESGEETGDIADSAGMIENMVKSGELVSGVGGGAGTLTLPLDDHEGLTEEDEMGEVESGEETGDIADSAGMIENMAKSGELVSGVGGGAGTLTLPLDDHEGLTEEDTDNRVTMVVSGMVNKNDGNVVSVVVDEVSVIHGKCVEKDTMPVEGRKGIK